MLDLRTPAPPLPDASGVRLTRPEYHREFREHRKEIRGSDSWKLERLQHFEETNDESRDALRNGDWPEVLRLFETERDDTLQEAREQESQGAPFHRIRVVEEPLTPYVQWELHWLRMRAECGHPVRVLPATAVASVETEGLLPELTLLGNSVLFRVIYTESGRPDGAIRFTDPHLVQEWAAYLEKLYVAAESMQTYFDRVVAPLAPPAAA
ncbi:hypothetical protein OG422_20260 [Streptomyces sp. NBC_01525]|uniref:DUF6879 family protein n=1 Tax=Streptomyces sp. NBC_01525 TaxID=2903893 RepID=UPI0038702428